MTRGSKVAGILAALFVIGLAAMPIETEMQVRAARKYLASSSRVDDCVAEFGAQHRAVGGESERSLADRLSLEFSEGDTILVFQREGLPYWAIYIATSDGETIKDSVVERFW